MPGFAQVCDPLTAWQRQSDQVKHLAEWIEGREEVRIQADGTDITLGVSGRRWIPCVGEHNMPDGEFFTGPIEDAVNGEISFSFPASYGGRTVSGVRFRFEDGKVVDASADQGEDFLLEMLDTDSGARRLGELGIGTNFGIITDVQTGPNGNLFVISLSDGNIYELFRVRGGR